MGKSLSIDETSLSNGELYTIVTNKAAHGRKHSIVAMVLGTDSDTVLQALRQIDSRLRNKVTEITLDLADSMHRICRYAFPRAKRVIDRFHVQKLGAGDAHRPSVGCNQRRYRSTGTGKVVGDELHP